MRKFLLGGEQQRCAIARAVVNNPKLLFADEPTGALNRKNTKEVLNLLTELNQSGMERAFETADSGEIVAFVKAEDMTGELKEKVETSDLVERVVYYDAICSNGQRIGEHEDGNSAFLMEMREGIEVYNEKLDGFIKNVPELKSGEIYLPLGLRSKLSCEVGDTTTINFIMGVKKKFKIKGFIQEPTQGAMMIGWKQLFISKGDYDMILKECHDIQLRDEQAKELVVDALVKEYSELSDINSLNTGYVSLNGENLYCEVYEIPEKIPGLLEGREPLYDNEIIVTKLVAESLELEIGDEVKVSSAEKEADYMISGIYQSISDTGMTFSMSGKGMERLKGEVMEFQNRYYIIENKTQLEGKSIEVKII